MHPLKKVHASMKDVLINQSIETKSQLGFLQVLKKFLFRLFRTRSMYCGCVYRPAGRQWAGGEDWDKLLFLYGGNYTAVRTQDKKVMPNKHSKWNNHSGFDNQLVVPAQAMSPCFSAPAVRLVQVLKWTIKEATRLWQNLSDVSNEC